jgi:DedD protein
MEFKSDEFLNNLEIEKEKAQLKKQADALDAQKNPSVVKTQPLFDDEPVIVDIKHNIDQGVSDIRIEQSNTKVDKKKYLLLGAALIILFILTIVIIKLISYDTKEKELFVQPKVENIKQDTILDNNEYQHIIEKKAKKTIQKELDISSIAQEEIPLPKIEPKEEKPENKNNDTSTDLFDMETKENVILEPIVEEYIKKTKPVVKKAVKPKITKNSSKSSGIYIQVGAFAKTPSKRLLSKIENNNFNYIIHQMTIKNRLYNKVLIGPYSSKAVANVKLSTVKVILNKPSAYIMRIK